MVRKRLLLGAMIAVLVGLLAFSPAPAQAGMPVYTNFMISDQPEPLGNPAVAYSAQHQEHLVVWCATSGGDSIVYGRKVPKNGALGPLLTLSGTDPGHKHCYPDVAYDTQQDRYLIVWEYSDGGYDNVQGRLLYANGSLSGDLTFDTGSALRNRSKPRVAYGYTRDKYMLVWEAITVGSISSDIEGQAVNEDGTKRDTNFTIAQGTPNVSHDQPALGYNISRNEYLVAWRRYDKNSPNYDIFGRRVTYNSFLLGSELLIGYYTAHEYLPAVTALQSPAPQSGIYLVAWQLEYKPGDNDIYARLVEGDGTLGALVEMTGTASNLDETHPVVTADPAKHRFLGLWTSTFNTQYTFTGLRGREISQDGQSGPLRWINGIFADQAAAAPGSHGDFLVVFQEDLLTANADIYGRRWGNRIFVPQIRR